MRLERLLNPRSIAIFGATENISPARRLIEALDTIGFPGPVYPINPRYETVLGKTCYPSIEAIPHGVDAIVFCVNHTLVMEPYRKAAAHGIGAAVVLDGGFAEKGEEGKARQREILGISREAGMALCGPNCMGVFNPAFNSTLYSSVLVDPKPIAGNVAFITQSGSIAIGQLTDVRRYGFSHVISAGNEAVTTTADYIDYLADEPETKVIATFTEAIRDPEKYIAALDKAAARGKPVVVLKVGKADRTRAAITGHTGGLAGESKVVSQILKRHRAIEVNDMDELTEVLAVCQGARWPKGPRIGVMTASGGQAELILDLATEHGINLPPLTKDGIAESVRVLGSVSGDGNPLDSWGDGKFQTNLPHGLKVLTSEPHLDAVVMASDTRDGQSFAPTQYQGFLVEASKTTDKACYFMSTRSGLFREDYVAQFRSAGLVQIGGTRQGLGAIRRLGEWMEGPPPARPSAALATGGLARALGASAARKSINEFDAKRIFGELGIRISRERRVTDSAEAVQAARAIGYPVVLKVVSDRIPHRSEHGLVAVGIRDEAALTKAFTTMMGKLAGLGADAAGAAFLVQEMIGGGVEVFAGISADPDFGPSLAFGLGGIHVELFRDVSLRPVPLRAGEAEAMIAETKAGKLLAGFRGAPASDTAALADVLYRLADWAHGERNHVQEVDLNPIKVLPAGQGCVVVDALIVPKAKEQKP
ncbi:MAG: acetate--CoA ligase family protein [Alphaproteobacteria bacterium]|nr:acetate--CoA ligase family protein [Alphaproteobacteria bacterium]